MKVAKPPPTAQRVDLVRSLNQSAAQSSIKARQCHFSSLMAQFQLVHGDLLDQPTAVIVNAWNRNIIPWWLLLPQGVSGAIKRRAGIAPFVELGRLGPIPLGEARITGAGRLPQQAIVHVAGISMWWRSSRMSIEASTRHALDLVQQRGFASVAMPLIGAGTGGGSADQVQDWMAAQIAAHAYAGQVLLVRHVKP